MHQLIGHKAKFLFAFSDIDQGMEDEFHAAKGERARDQPHPASVDDAVSGKRDNPNAVVIRMSAGFLLRDVIPL